MMRAAWKLGENAAGFVIRLAGDFADPAGTGCGGPDT